MPAEHRAGVEALRGQPAPAAHAALGQALGPMLAGLDDAGRLGMVGATDADADVLAGAGVRARLAAMMDRALAQGATGVVADIAGYMLRPWGFDPADVRVPVLLGYGAQDAGVGPAHGEWWARQLPDAALEVVPGVGHLVVVPLWGRVLDHLVPRG
ncbi:MAG TPA: hypothetical protein VEZ42_06240 [Pseudonocardia sp.]|nr:hypothetical protein [Pseudonocardia sp.]